MIITTINRKDVQKQSDAKGRRIAGVDDECQPGSVLFISVGFHVFSTIYSCNSKENDL